MQVAHAAFQRRLCAGGGQGAVQAPAPPLWKRAATPQARKFAARHQFQPARAHDFLRGLGHPHFHPALTRLDAPHQIVHAEGLPERPFLGANRPQHVRARIRLEVDAADGHPFGKRDGLGQQPGLAHHDRLGVLGLKTVFGQALGQVSGCVVPARLPLEGGELRIGGVVGDGLRDQAIQRRPRQSVQRAV